MSESRMIAHFKLMHVIFAVQETNPDRLPSESLAVRHLDNAYKDKLHAEKLGCQYLVKAYTKAYEYALCWMYAGVGRECVRNVRGQELADNLMKSGR